VKADDSMTGAEDGFDLRLLDAYLTESVTDVVLPPADDTPSLLPFSQRSPEDFERICVVVAEQVDGLRDVRMYGVPGQRQQGIDVVGWDTDGRAVVYQARRRATFTARDLARAVDDYVASGRAFKAKRFVICVASSGRRTEVIDELARQKAGRDFEIDLYDQERLSTLLRERGDLVRRFFGEAWERLFCAQEAVTPPARSASDVLADALLRGPLDALGLAEGASAAELLIADEPGKASEEYGRIADALSGSEFGGFSDAYRLRQAECLERSGDSAGAVGFLADVAWRDVERGARWRADQVVRKLEDLSHGPGAPAYAAVLVSALRAVDRWHSDPSFELSAVLPAIEQLVVERAPRAREAVLWLAESAVVSEDRELVGSMAAMLDGVAAEIEKLSPSDAVAVRLRICLADASGDWSALRNQALGGRLGPRQAMLVHARMGRAQAWSAEPRAAEASYRLAIGQACQAGLQAEAAAALRSTWTIGSRYGLPVEEWSGAVDLARDVQVAGRDYFLSAYDFRAAGLSELSNDDLSSALGDLRANLRVAALSGRLAGEIEAHSLLGALYLRAGEPGLAAQHLLRAGDAKELEESFGGLEKYVDCSDGLDRRAPWERAATLSALAAEGDLLPDDEVDRLVRAALDAANGQEQGPFGAQVWVTGYKLLAAVGVRIPVVYVDRVLDLLREFVEREPNHYRFNDKEHARIVADLFLVYPERRERTGPHLLALMGASPELGDQVLSVGWRAIDSGRDVLLDGLRALATTGSKAALRALLYLNVEDPALVDEARRLLESAVNRPKRKPGTYGIGSMLPGAAAFMGVLAETDRVRFAEAAMDSAEDDSDVEANRGEAVEAVGFMGDLLPAPVRRALFDRAISLASAPTYSKIDEQFRGAGHPLSRFRINLGAGLLVPEAVKAAAALAQDDGEYRRVVELAAPLFRSEDAVVTNLAAHALLCLPRHVVDIDLRMLAASPVNSARQLAAVLWASRPEDLPGLGATLASDSDRGVREALASALPTLREMQTDLAKSIAAMLADDPSARVRRQAQSA